MLRSGPFLSIDLFCGCGGLSLGLRYAGFEVVAAVDNDPLSVSTYRRNHSIEPIEEDIEQVDPQELMEELGLEPRELDLLAGCPPCQGFSTLRTLNGSRLVYEPLNDLVFEFIRFCTRLPTEGADDGERAGVAQRLAYGASRSRTRRTRLSNMMQRYGTQCSVWRTLSDGGARYCWPPEKEYGRPSFAPPVRGRRTVAGTLRRLPPPGSLYRPCSQLCRATDRPHIVDDPPDP